MRYFKVGAHQILDNNLYNLTEWKKKHGLGECQSATVNNAITSTNTKWIVSQEISKIDYNR